jgi:cyclase
MEIEKTLHEVGSGVFAYTQLPGSWGWSNAGLIVDGDQSLLVDTLFDRRITGEMLAEMRRAAPAAQRIGTVVNTHGNGDHCYGNGEVPGAEIIGSQGCVDDLAAAPPSRNATLMRAAHVVQALGGAGRAAGRICSTLGLHTVAWLVEAAPFALPLFDTFEFGGNDLVLPTRTFADRLSLKVGDCPVELMELGPAHTLGDTVVYLPDERILFTGDLLFKDAHPLIWQGPTSNWIRACHTLLDLDVDTVVPGHGPLTDLSGIQETLEYLEWLTVEARARYDAGLTVEQAAREISIEAYRAWLDAERVFVNVHTLYRDFAGNPDPPEILELLAGMARLVADTEGAGS